MGFGSEVEPSGGVFLELADLVNEIHSFGEQLFCLVFQVVDLRLGPRALLPSEFEMILEKPDACFLLLADVG